MRCDLNVVDYFKRVLCHCAEILYAQGAVSRSANVIRKYAFNDSIDLRAFSPFLRLHGLGRMTDEGFVLLCFVRWHDRLVPGQIQSDTARIADQGVFREACFVDILRFGDTAVVGSYNKR